MHYREGVQKESARPGCSGSAAEEFPPSAAQPDEITQPVTARWPFCSAAALPEASFADPSEIGSSGLPAAAATDVETAATVDVEAVAAETAAAEAAVVDNAVVEIAIHRLAFLLDLLVCKSTHSRPL